MKNILIVYTSSGFGHKKIAENIADALSQDNNVDLVDLFSVEAGKIVRWGTKTYLWILEFIPGLWNFFYTNELFLKITLPFRTTVAAGKSKKILGILQSKNYDVVISTQVNASSILSYLKMKNLLKAKLAVSFSDFHLHPFWLFKNVDLFLANTQQQKEEMVLMGYKAEQIAVCGITLKKPPEVNVAEVKQKYSLPLDKKILLLMGGGRGLAINHEIVSELSELNAYLVVVCGKNEDLQKKLSSFFRTNTDIKILGFVENMNELYAITDVLVSKPGGLTVAEALSVNVPLAVSQYLPGQEKFNYDYLVDHRLILDGLNSLTGMIKEELNTGEFRKELRNNPARNEIVQYGDTVKQAISAL